MLGKPEKYAQLKKKATVIMSGRKYLVRALSLKEVLYRDSPSDRRTKEGARGRTSPLTVDQLGAQGEAAVDSKSDWIAGFAKMKMSTSVV